MRVIRTSMSYNPLENWGEVNHKPSETVPDQTIPIRKLLENYTRGALPVGQRPYWDDQEELDLKLMDLVDLQELGMAARRSIDDFNAIQKKKLDDDKALLEKYRKLGNIEDLDLFIDENKD